MKHEDVYQQACEHLDALVLYVYRVTSSLPPHEPLRASLRRTALDTRLGLVRAGSCSCDLDREYVGQTRAQLAALAYQIDLVSRLDELVGEKDKGAWTEISDLCDVTVTLVNAVLDEMGSIG